MRDDAKRHALVGADHHANRGVIARIVFDVACAPVLCDEAKSTLAKPAMCCAAWTGRAIHFSEPRALPFGLEAFWQRAWKRARHQRTAFFTLFIQRANSRTSGAESDSRLQKSAVTCRARHRAALACAWRLFAAIPPSDESPRRPACCPIQRDGAEMDTRLPVQGDRAVRRPARNRRRTCRFDRRWRWRT